MAICPRTCLLEELPESVMLTDVKGNIQYVNDTFEKITGYHSAEALGRTPSILRSSRQPPEFYRHFWNEILAGNVFREVFINRHKDGSLFYEDKSITPVKDASGEITHFLAVGRDITHRIEERDRLQQLAYHDDLTGLPNRPLLMDRLNSAIDRAQRNATVLAVALLDLDRFKSVNDSLGHAAGDELLKQTAHRLRSCLRQTDTVSRLAGDEFVVLLEGLHHRAEAATALDKVSNTLVAPFRLNDHEVYQTCSVGVTTGPYEDDDTERLLIKADMAMYAAKRKGRDNLQYYSTALMEQFGDDYTRRRL